MPNRRPMPADFAEVAPGKNVRQLQMIYQAGGKAVSRWLIEAGFPPRNHGNHKMFLPSNIAELCEAYGVREIARMIGWSCDTLRAKLKKERPDLHAKAVANGIAKRSANAYANAEKASKKAKLVQVAKRRASPLYKIQIKRHDDAAIKEADKARAYLQRFGPCFSDAYSANPGRGGYWFRGNHFETDALIAEAYRRGWKPDGWREIAA
jgi:hypothetical protein